MRRLRRTPWREARGSSSSTSRRRGSTPRLHEIVSFAANTGRRGTASSRATPSSGSCDRRPLPRGHPLRSTGCARRNLANGGARGRGRWRRSPPAMGGAGPLVAHAAWVERELPRPAAARAARRRALPATASTTAVLWRLLCVRARRAGSPAGARCPRWARRARPPPVTAHQRGPTATRSPRRRRFLALATPPRGLRARRTVGALTGAESGTARPAAVAAAGRVGVPVLTPSIASGRLGLGSSPLAPRRRCDASTPVLCVAGRTSSTAQAAERRRRR